MKYSNLTKGLVEIVAFAAILLALITLPRCTTRGTEPASSDGVLYTAIVHFTVNAVVGPAVFLSPRSIESVDGRATVTLGTKDLPPARTMNLVLSGCRIADVRPLTNGTDLVTLYSDSIVTLGVAPGADLLGGTSPVCELDLEVDADNDTTHVEILECVVRDSTRTDIDLTMTRGCTVVGTDTEAVN